MHCAEVDLDIDAAVTRAVGFACDYLAGAGGERAAWDVAVVGLGRLIGGAGVVVYVGVVVVVVDPEVAPLLPAAYAIRPRIRKNMTRPNAESVASSAMLCLDQMFVHNTS